MKEILNFLTTSGRLKFTYRYSEVSKIPKESSAAHSWQLSLMVFLIADELNLDINIERALKIAIIHDIAEALTGDVDMILIKDKKVTKEEKYQLEIKAINKLQEFFSKSSKIKDLWQEYQENKTKEARFVKALDKIERGHSVQDSINAIKTLRNLGYKLNFHMMLGLPGISRKEDLEGLKVGDKVLYDFLSVYYDTDPIVITKSENIICKVEED